ncbi:MAG: hypothetical protein ABIS50_15325 [Luteolibacter sp.]|uniref:hypothetical protein n=1 Tax=Luteolibacter sp. TaxID=1962973 RepID=UPI003266C853
MPVDPATTNLSPREQLIAECDEILRLSRAAQADAAPDKKSAWADRLDHALDIRSRLMAGRPKTPTPPSNPTTTHTA